METTEPVGGEQSPGQAQVRAEIRVQRHRCPFCHDDCDPDERHVVCQACLTRHHVGCWNEGGRCSSCGDQRRLEAFGRQQRQRLADADLLPVSPHPGLRRLIDGEKTGYVWSPSWSYVASRLAVIAVFTAGVVTIPLAILLLLHLARCLLGVRVEFDADAVRLPTSAWTGEAWRAEEVLGVESSQTGLRLRTDSARSWREVYDFGGWGLSRAERDWLARRIDDWRQARGPGAAARD